MTAVADINGRKLTSKLMFKHNHPGHGHGVPDELNKRNDATWNQGRDAFIRLMAEYSQADLKKITDPGMINWLRGRSARL